MSVFNPMTVATTRDVWDAVKRFYTHNTEDVCSGSVQLGVEMDGRYMPGGVITCVHVDGQTRTTHLALKPVDELLNLFGEKFGTPAESVYRLAVDFDLKSLPLFKFEIYPRLKG